MTMSSCVPGFDQLTRWSGKACALWSGRTPEEKRQWVQNYFLAHGLMANQSSIATLVAQMDVSCSVAPAGSLYDGLNEGFDPGNQGDSNQQSEFERVATDRYFNQTLQTGINAIGNTTLGIVQSNNKQTPTFPNNNPIGGFGGLGGYPQGSGVSGGFVSPFGYGSGAISWTPIIIGGVIVVGLGVLLVTMSNRRS